jgi:hypothetical protein
MFVLPYVSVKIMSLAADLWLEFRLLVDEKGRVRLKVIDQVLELAVGDSLNHKQTKLKRCNAKREYSIF